MRIASVGSCGLRGDHDRPRNAGPDQGRLRRALNYLRGFISLAWGIGLLWQRPAAVQRSMSRWRENPARQEQLLSIHGQVTVTSITLQRE